MKYEFGKDGRPTRNFKNGQFMKGHVPHNAGKKWDEWLSPEKQARILETGKKNLRVNTALWGWNKRPVVAVNENGEHRYCESAQKAAEIMKLDKNNINSCCRGKRARCGGLYWFYFDSPEWPALAKKKREAAQAEKFNK